MKTYSHFISYFEDNKLVKSEFLAEVINPDIYWQHIIEGLKIADNGYLETGKFEVIFKSARVKTGYCIERLIVNP